MPLDVRQAFADRERSDDAAGSAYMRLDENFVDDENHCEFCIAAEYKPGPHGKAVVAFRSSETIDLSSARSLTFVARGETGGEIIKVYAAGVKNKNADVADGAVRGVKYAAAGQVTLDREWHRYTLDLAGLELKQVTHGFAFEVMKAKENEPQVIYIDAVFYDDEEPSDAVRLN